MRYFYLTFVFLFACSTSQKIEPLPHNPVIKISLRQTADKEFLEKIDLSLADLQKELKETTFEVKKHPVYNKDIQYRGFYFKDVIALIAQKLKIKTAEKYLYSVWASDNFSAFVSPEDLKSGQAFLAWREVGKDFWTPIEKHGNPGPFYLIWDNPEKTYWQKWPFKISEITFVSRDIEKKFKAVMPDEDFVRMKGYRLVLKNCTACHSINNVGFASMGPDLKLLGQVRSKDEFLIQVRTPKGKMISFSPGVLSDEDVAAIHAYLKSLVP